MRKIIVYGLFLSIMSCGSFMEKKEEKKDEIQDNKIVLENKEVSKMDTVKKTTEKPSKEIEKKNETQETVTILGVGDMMLGTHFPSREYLPPNDGKDLLAPVTSIIQSADVAFGNLEGVILSGEGKVKNCQDPTKCYAFKMPDHYAEYFKEAGFDVLSVANNHVGDFGEEGRQNTMRLLDKIEMKYAGLLKCPSTTFEKNGIKYGFCAFAPNTGTMSITDLDGAKAIVAELDKKCDIVIVSFHGGAEGSTKTHITRADELFLGENRGNPYQFARAVIDAGADVVFGHGPHVTRAVDMYKGKFIAYSLGNFATYGRFNLKGVSGVAPIIVVKTDKKGNFLSAKIHATKQLGEGGPVMDDAGSAISEIIRLTAEDVPETPLQISNTGNITKK